MKMYFTPGPRNDGQTHLGTTEKPANLAPWQQRCVTDRWLGGVVEFFQV